MARIAATLFLSVALAFGQAGRITNQGPTNLDFSEGEAGKTPPGWEVPPIVLHAGYTAELRRGDCPGFFSVCVFFQAPAVTGTVHAEELAQSFSARAYLGRKIRFSGWLRVQGPGRGDIELRMRVDHANGEVEFFDSVDGPVQTGLQRREVAGRVSPDAVTISIWARFHPPGPAWLFDPAFETVEDSRIQEDDDADRALIQKFADLRNAHDGYDVAALYSQAGEWFGPTGQGAVRGRQALATLWGSVAGQVGRKIESVDFPGGNIAVVHVGTQYPEPIGRHNETFVAVKEDGTWYIRVHQTIN